MTAAQRSIFKIGIICLILFLGIKVRTWWIELPWQGSIDYSMEPPAQTFKFVTGISILPGVSNLRIAGRTHPGKWFHWIWMRFHATDEVIEQLTDGIERYEGSEARRVIQASSGISRSSRYDATDLQRVRWHEVARMSNPEVYPISCHFPEPVVLIGSMIVDRRKNVIYVYAEGD